MVTSADHDDRVVPAHSFKYIATLQEKNTGKNPVLIRIETEAGEQGNRYLNRPRKWQIYGRLLFIIMKFKPVY